MWEMTVDVERSQTAMFAASVFRTFKSFFFFVFNQCEARRAARDVSNFNPWPKQPWEPAWKRLARRRVHSHVRLAAIVFGGPGGLRGVSSALPFPPVPPFHVVSVKAYF